MTLKTLATTITLIGSILSGGVYAVNQIRELNKSLAGAYRQIAGTANAAYQQMQECKK